MISLKRSNSYINEIGKLRIDKYKLSSLLIITNKTRGKIKFKTNSLWVNQRNDDVV